MDVGGNRVGREALGQHGAGGLPGERAHAMADVEEDAALARRKHFRLDLALAVDRRIGKGPVAMGEDVARAQALDDLLIGGRRLVDMGHQRQAGLVRDLQRDIERGDTSRPAGRAADAHLDADDHVAVGIRDLDRIPRRQEPHIVALAHHDVAGEAVDAGEGDMQVGEDPHLARIDDVLAEAWEIARSGAAGVDAGRHRAGPGKSRRRCRATCRPNRHGCGDR